MDKYESTTRLLRLLLALSPQFIMEDKVLTCIVLILAVVSALHIAMLLG